VALPSGAAVSSNINHLAKGLGKTSCIELQCVSKSFPNPFGEHHRTPGRSRMTVTTITINTNPLPALPGAPNRAPMVDGPSPANASPRAALIGGAA
jgi:hypothetical protein